MKKLILGTFTAVALLFCTACEQLPAQTTAKQEQSAKAIEAANSIKFTGNAEIESIKSRLELTSKPGAIGFVLLMNEAGQPIMYTAVKGKITSGSKRLTPPQEIRGFDCGNVYCAQLVDSPSDEGTYGSSNPYIYFTTMDGQYIQWSGAYLYSDKPFRTKIEPLVIKTTS